MANEPLSFEMLASIRSLIDEELLNTRTMLPAIVDKVYPDSCCVDVNLVINRVLTNGEILPVPTLIELPVSYPGNNVFSVTFPLAEGDEGLVVFADRDIQRFLVNGNQAAPAMQRRHSLSDGVFIPTNLSKNKREAAEADTLLLKAGSTAGIRVKTDGSIQLDGEVTVTKGLTVQEGVDATGEITSQQDVKAQTISLTQHTHIDSTGNPTQPPTPVP